MRLPREHEHRPVTLVWLDADEAIVLRSAAPGAAPDDATPQRIRSEVPPHRRATGHDHHDPRMRSGGGADPDDLAARRREHLMSAYLRRVVALLPPDDHVVVLGPGVVHTRLAAQIRADDLRHRRERPVEDEASAPLTDRQLRARLLAFAGESPERRRPANTAAR